MSIIFLSMRLAEVCLCHLCPAVIVTEDVLISLSLFSHAVCAVLAQAHSMPIPLGCQN